VLTAALLGLGSACTPDDGGQDTASAGSTDTGGASEASASTIASSTSAGSATDTDTDTDTDTAADGRWFELGYGEDEFAPLAPGDTVQLVRGGQGLLMFPTPVRGGGFRLPSDPRDYRSPEIPLLDVVISVEGLDEGFGGSFYRLANYPLILDVLPDGTYSFVYVALIVSDVVADLQSAGLIDDVYDLEGRTMTIDARIRPYEEAAIEWRIDELVIDVDELSVDP